MPSSRGSSQFRDQTQVSHIAGGFFTVWATGEAQEYWSGWPIPSSGDFPNPGSEPGSPAGQEDSLPAELPGKPCVKPRGAGLQETGWDPGILCFSACPWTHVSYSNKIQSNYKGLSASLVAQMVKNLPAMQNQGLIPGMGRYPGGGHGNTF